MNITQLEAPGLMLIELKVLGDARGFFVERFQAEKFREAGIPGTAGTAGFLQDNHSRSAPGVLRGLHYQFDRPQGKLVGVVRGRIWDVAADIRPHSPTFGKWYAEELSDLNGRLLWIPPGFAHGFCVLGDEPADVLYKVDALYNPRGEAGIAWDDADLAISWPIKNPTISARDKTLATLAEYRKNPPPWPAPGR
ncbi:MAG TPA: dTDP-4-dehydrorhamnose 3,5-epimerase [Tepidisphaeraceae bacterium]|jgi:dTDP-4-dehydrorhamnose 3,5-epimerase|nr:dTDP-4-dehydrorhamnose 3,5-epimerase [Tepidisphaeraceae bacterium]